MHCGKTASDKLEKTEQAGFKIDFNDNVNTYTTLLEVANMLYLHDRRVQDMCILIYKVIHGRTPSCLQVNHVIYGVTLILVQPRVITTKYGLKIWNSLNDELTTAPTLKKFITRIRNITFDACNCSLCNC